MRIGELAEVVGAKQSAIRFYERRGLLPPPSRTSTGYRDYDDSARARMTFIQSGQAMGLTLAEIREILDLRDQGVTPCAHVSSLIETHERRIAQQIEDLQNLRIELRRLSERARSLDPAECRPDQVCHVIPQPRADA